MTKKDRLKHKLTNAGIEFDEDATGAQLEALLSESLPPTKPPKVKKTTTEQVPLALCNKYALFVASELKKQRAQAILDSAKAIVEASKKE